MHSFSRLSPYTRALLILALVGGGSLIACQFPARLIAFVRPQDATLTPTLTAPPSLTPTSSPTSGGKKPIQVTLTPEATETSYPGPNQPEEPLPEDSPTPDAGAALYPPATEAIGTIISPDTSPTATLSLTTPLATVNGADAPSPFVPPTLAALSPYPGEETPVSPPQSDPSPEATTANNIEPTTTSSPQPTPLETDSSGVGPSPFPPGTPTETFAATGEAPTATVFALTMTPTPTRTPFLTPTPTLTLTPTPTRTPLPAPPWRSARILASDPRVVKLAAGKPQLVEFFAYWSGPSLAMAPLIQGIEREYAQQVQFTYLDIDNPVNEEFKRQLGFRVEPHFILLDATGKVLSQWIGYVSVNQLRQALDKALK